MTTPVVAATRFAMAGVVGAALGAVYYAQGKVREEKD